MNYDLTSIQTDFLGLIKFKRDYNVSSLDSDMVGLSTSGKYYNMGVNPLVSLRNLQAFAPLAADMSVGDWAADVTYSKYDAVVVSGTYYYSLVSPNLNKLVTDTASWSETTLFSIWIRQRLFSIFETVISKAMLADKLFDHAKMYTQADDSDPITNASNYVGFEIRPRNSEHLRIVLNRISTQLSLAQTDLNLYLYNQNTLAATIALSSLAEKELVFTDITDQDLSGEGRWFLFYDQDDLTGEAYNWPISNPSSYVDILPFEVANTTTDFINDVGAYSTNSYGLGLDFSVYANLTQFIKDNKQAFIEAIHLQWQYDILELFTLNPDVQVSAEGRNIDIQSNREYIIGELKSDARNSLVSKLDYAYKILRRSVDFKEIALPGDNEQAITFISIG